MILKSVFTTGEASDVCHVSQQTIIRNFDDGRLKGYRIPGSRFRRIPRHELITFMREYNIPLGYLAGEGAHTVVAVTADQFLKDSLTAAVTVNQGFNILFTGDTFEAGTIATDVCARAVIVDDHEELRDACRIANYFRQKSDMAATNVVALVPCDPPLGPPEGRLGIEVFKKPFDPRLLVERLQTLCRSA